MNNINHLLEVLSGKLGGGQIRLDGNGQARIALGGELAAHVTRIDDAVLELSFALSDLDFADPHMLGAMMEANFLGAATGYGRLAVDPVSDETIYCERWNAQQMDADAVESRFEEFARCGVYWLTEGGAALLAEAAKRRAAARPAAEAAPPAEDEIRIAL